MAGTTDIVTLVGALVRGVNNLTATIGRSTPVPPTPGTGNQFVAINAAGTGYRAVAPAPAPVSFGNEGSGITAISATSPTFSTPSDGVLSCLIQAVTSINAYPVTASASLGGGTLTTQSGAQGASGLFTLPMKAGQSTTITIGNTAPSSCSFGLSGFLFFTTLGT